MSKPLCAHIFTCKCSMQSHWSGSRPLVSITLLMLGPHWDSSWISCCCPVLPRSCNFGSGPQAPSCAPEDHRWGRCWGKPSHSPGSGPGQLQGWSTHWRGELSKYLVTALPSRTQKLYFSVNHEIVLYSSHCFKYCILFIIFKE